MSVYNGGTDDLILWTLEVDDGIRSERVFGSRYPVVFQGREPDASLTLRGINKPECEAVIAFVNEMRSRSQSISAPPVKPGNRFSGLEFE